jgi:hypothetical protein
LESGRLGDEIGQRYRSVNDAFITAANMILIAIDELEVSAIRLVRFYSRESGESALPRSEDRRALGKQSLFKIEYLAQILSNSSKKSIVLISYVVLKSQ